MHPLLISLCLCSLGLVAVLLVRKPARGLFGAGPAFSLWLLPPLLALTPWLPAIPMHWSTPQALATLPGVRMLLVHVTANATAPASTHWLLWIWIGGSALLVLRMLAHCIRVRRNSAAPSPHMLRELRALMDPRDLQRVHVHSMGPAVLWSTRSQVLLPADFLDRFTPQQRRAVLAHECMHLRRGDAWWNLLAELGLAVLWFNPLAWWALPRLHLDMELACDAAVLRRLPDNHAAYAQALLSNAGLDARPHLVAWLNPPQLKERLTMISRPQNSSLRRRCGYLLFAVVLAAGTLAAQAIASTQDIGNSVPSDTIHLAVASSGALSWNGQNISSAQLKTRLATAAKRDPQPSVMVEVQPYASVDRMYALIRSVKQSGIVHAGFTPTADAPSVAGDRDSRKIYTVKESAGKQDSPATIVLLKPDNADHPPTQDVRFRQMHPASYPDEAKRNKQQGLVVLRVHVDANGAPSVVEVKQSSGYPSLDKAAIQAAKKWHFNPAVNDGKAQGGWVQIKVDFSLEEP